MPFALLSTSYLRTKVMSSSTRVSYKVFSYQMTLGNYLFEYNLSAYSDSLKFFLVFESFSKRLQVFLC